MASNTTSLALMPQTLELPGSLSASIRLFALGALLTFSFVPMSFLPGLTYGYINYSQIPLFALCVAVLCCYLVRFETDLLASLILIFLIAISQAIGTIHSPAAHKSFVTPLIFLNSLAIAPAIMLLARPLPVSTLIRLVHRIVNWVLIFLAVECVTRLILSPIIGANADTTDAFYLYKSSLFFVDSNFVGIEILCLLSIMFAFRGKIKRNRWLLAYFLLFASMSRASIVAGICQLVMYIFWRWRVWTFLGMLAAQVLIIGKLFTIYVTQGSEFVNSIDGSLSSKFFILTLMMDAYHEADTAQKFFGVGAGNFINLFGILSAHNIVVTFVTELGIGGSLLFAFYIWILSRKCPLSIYLLVLPILINGFSLVSAWAMPYFFAALGLLAALRGVSRDGIGAPENIAAGRKTSKG
ncbi:MAG: hypothetical protein ABSB30_09390 [Terracidiphilus sp.]|jgi:hypothetical protein